MLKPKKITFMPEHKTNELPTPKPARKNIPDWYKKAESWAGEGRPAIRNLGSNASVKHCMPFLDAITSGYLLELHTDVQVTRVPDSSTPLMTWMITPDPLVLRPPITGYTIPRPSGHDFDHWAWSGKFGIAVPAGYSVLVTHPFNRFDLPFTTMSGIMESDGHWAPGNIPFFLKEGFEGIIPAGTPIAQLLPFKREDWISEVDESESSYRTMTRMMYRARSVVAGYYKKNVWKKKMYD